MDSFHKWLRGEKSFSTQEQADIVINGSVSSMSYKPRAIVQTI
ncbi:hypothetical protein S3E15_02252 [Bacillus mycoides]|uniref:Uncharacterized protein n=1 Tax=Bacillus mycoides TaxID=1405 RepID=A0AAP7WD12_BACMY|nr:hypothetical protein SZ39_2789 [Bacillus mycoides]KUH46168.1 hypothetical protein M2E15_1216 [Bacillus mycoides]OSX87075.1 hypothetical protein BTJ44_02752 [Bacillus mycoides]OSX95774.1 hypothetical protein S3E15_02252 [Bacillus mycoides]OSY08575.1 hypothetical protein S2E19_04352 [Bacillus mycoides]